MNVALKIRDLTDVAVAAGPHAVEVEIRLDVEGWQPVTGTVEALGVSPATPFAGWLDLLRLLEALQPGTTWPGAGENQGERP